MALEFSLLRRLDCFKFDCFAVHFLIKLSFKSLELGVLSRNLTLHAFELLFGRRGNGVNADALFVQHVVTEQGVLFNGLRL